MEDTFTEFVIPGVFVQVKSEGLIGAGAVSTGNIGLVGTAQEGTDGETHVLSDYAYTRDTFGDYDAYDGGNGKFNLTRAAEILFRNGARTIFARALPLGDGGAQPGTNEYDEAFRELLKDDINILVAPQLSTARALEVLKPLVDSAETEGKDLIAVVGSDATDAQAIAGQVEADDRVILVAPGIYASDAAIPNPDDRLITLPGTYTAAAVAGLLSSLAPQTSPTNKVVSGVARLAQRFSYGETKNLVNAGVMVLEQRAGARVVRGVTTEMGTNGPFKQVTTRRIVDYAKAGIRQASSPFVGRLNNQRVRAALHGAVDGFLTTMVQNEALTGYKLEVVASRDDEINGRVHVRANLQPVFSIDFVAVTLVLE